MKKLISIAVTLSMLLGICSANVAIAADKPARIGTVQGANVTVDRHSSLYGMIYMDDDRTTGVYKGNDFLGDGHTGVGGATNLSLVALKYPVTIRTRAEGSAFPAQKATVDTTSNTLTSARTGITYKLPTRKAQDPSKYHYYKEGLTIDYKANNAGYKGTAIAREIAINQKVDSIHLLLGSAQLNGNKNFVKAFVKYTDGSYSLPTATVSNSGAWNVSVKFPSDVVILSEAADGRNGYLYTHMQDAKAATQTANNNFVADFETYSYTLPSESGNYTYFATDAEHTLTFTKDEAESAHTIAAYEYYLDVDESKTVETLYIAGESGSAKSGFSVLGVETQKTATINSFDYLSDAKNANLFVKADTSADGYKNEWNLKHFLGAGMSTKDSHVAIVWPLVALGGTYSPTGTLTNVDGSNATIKTKNGNTYYITNTTGQDAKDAIILDQVRADSAVAQQYGFTLPASVTVDLDDEACNTVSFLTAHASYGTQDVFKAYVKYTDGSTSFPANTELATDDNGRIAQLSGNSGYVYGKLPYFYGSLSDQKAKNFVMRLKSFAYGVGNIANATSATKTFTAIDVVGSDTDSRQAMVYEHILTVDPNKVVDEIVFENQANGTYIDGIAILGVATKPVFVANPIEFTEGSIEVDAYSDVEGEVYAAVYVRATKKLVAAKKVDIAAGAVQTITVDDKNLVTTGNYDIKLFIWDTNGTFKPLSAPLTDKYRAPAAE